MADVTTDLAGMGKVTARSASCRDSHRRRALEVVGFVAVWVALGYLLDLGSDAYLLVGIPLTLGFQVLVRRRPAHELFAAGRARFQLDRRGWVVATSLGVVPGGFAVRALMEQSWTSLGWYVAATAGAVCAAFALRSGSALAALRDAALPMAVGASGMALVYTVMHLATGAPISPGSVAISVVVYTALYFPATFLLEEVSFRGALDAHVHHEGDGRGWASAVLVSVLWGVWHLPVSHALPFPQQLLELVVVHVLLGVPLSLAWRRRRNLAGPALAHAVNDAVRNGFMLGL